MAVATADNQYELVAVNGRPVTSPELRGRFSSDRRFGVLEHGEPDVRYRNQGDGRFTPVDWTAGAFLDPERRPVEIPYDWALSAMRDIRTAMPSSIDEYIADFPPDVREALQKIRDIIRAAAPDAVETIKYRIPTFVLGENLVHFAGFKKHIGFYPTPSAIRAFGGELADYESAKGSVQFPLHRPVPYSLIWRMVEFRVKEAREKMVSRKRRRW